MSENTEQTRPADEPPKVEAADAPATETKAESAPEAAVAEELAAEAPTGEAAEPAEEDIKSKKVTLADLSAKGTALYAHKQYEDATELFSQASVLQAEINGELAAENAEILFHYGRSLFKVGQSKSDVLGGTAAGAKAKPNGSGAAKPPSFKPAASDAQKVTQAGVGIAAEKKEGESTATDAKKPLFQFTGDENFDDSDEEEEEGDGEPEEEEDDLATAFEILDLARVCYNKQLEAIAAGDDAEKGREAAKSLSPAERHVKERLADTHDTLAEISLENERYPNAIEDGRVSLDYKMELYPEESEIIAEAHYKLSLALEFASVTTSDESGANAKREDMDQGLRDEAVKEMELAIKSFNLKMQVKEVDLATMASPEDNELTRRDIADMKELIADMEQRLVDLRKNPVDAQDLLGGPEANALGGIFGAILGESTADKAARVEEAKKTATDLTGMVRKKAKPETPEAQPTNGKRKADGPAETAAESPKKAKVEGGDA